MTTEEWIEAALAKAPPLTDEQRLRLARLLHPVRIRAESKHVGYTRRPPSPQVKRLTA